jgi:hypothetical protein
VKSGSVAVGFLDPGQWSHCFGQSLINLYLGDAFGSQRLVPHGKQLRNFCSTGGLVAGRNEIARQFLDLTECEWLFMVDSDMGFAPDTVDRLIASADRYQRPVMGGLCFGQQRVEATELHAQRFQIVPTLYAFEEQPDKVGFRVIPDYARGEVVQVSGTGAACLLVHRRALFNVREKYGPEWFTPVTHPTGPTTFSEDLSFCIRLAGADIPVYVDTSVKTVHDKGGVFLDEEEFDRQMFLVVHMQQAEEVVLA